MHGERVISVLLVVSLGLYIFFDEFYPSLQEGAYYTTTETIDLFETCPLTVYDPFYKDIGMTIRYKNPLEGCNRKYSPMTQMKGGKVLIKPSNSSDFRCRARCYDYKHPTKSVPRAWVNITEKTGAFDCDFVHAECLDQENQVIDSYMHMQIVETNKSTVPDVKQPPDAKMPDIYVFILDSVSSTQARRSLPRTLSFLEHKMGGMHMHHLNKVGENSRPNGFAMFLGWRLSYIHRKAMGAEDLHSEYNSKAVCKRYLDNETIIFREFEKIGYKTLFSDDYPQGNVFTWGGCKGFAKQETSHVFSPFIYARKTDQKLRERIWRGNCLEPYALQLQYASKFVNSYEGKNKFLVNWMSEITHDDTNLLFHGDEPYENFFRANQKKLENFFIFFMADHGPRYGAVAWTILGKRELKNPLLHITVPKWLRGNRQLMENLKANSVSLLTQYDVYATLVDILKYAPKSNFSDFSFLPIKEAEINNGTSILRPMGPFAKRNCRNIPVNAAYCLCEYRKEGVSEPDIRLKMGDSLLKEINQILKEKNLTSLCSLLKIEKIMSTSSFVPVNRTNLYEILIKAKPGGGEFSTVLTLKENHGEFERKGEILRINAYEEAGDCVPQDLPEMKPLCYCRNQTKPITMKLP